MSDRDMHPTDTLEALKSFDKGSDTLMTVTDTYTIRNVKYTQADLKTKIKTYLVPYADAKKAADQYKKAMDTRMLVEPDAMDFVNDMAGALKGMYGANNPALGDWGVKPEKEPTPLTTEQQAAKNAKILATRKARHTMGKKQKEAIKGEVPAPAPAPAPDPDTDTDTDTDA